MAGSYSSLHEISKLLSETQWEVLELLATESHQSNAVLASKLYMTSENLRVIFRNISNKLSLNKGGRTYRYLIQVYWEAKFNERDRELRKATPPTDGEGV